jgi:hypothetical protein
LENISVAQIADVVRLVHARCSLLELSLGPRIRKLGEELEKERARSSNIHRRLIEIEAELRKLRQQRKR